MHEPRGRVALAATPDAPPSSVVRLPGRRSADERGRSSFENLFRISPIPIMEQDYTELEAWMEGLRREGVTSIRDHLGSDVEAIRAIVPMIRIIAANPAAVRAVGVPASEIIGRVDPRIVNEGAQDGWLAQIEAVWSGTAEVHASFSGATADGRRFDAESILAAPIVEGHPDFSRAVFTLIDVTAHRDEQRRVRDMVEAKNRFLASVSHEIRTPLTAILGFSRLLEDESALDPDDRRLMTTSIAQHAQEMADLVEDLLVAARVESGRVEVVESVFDVVRQVETTLEAGGAYTDGVRFEHDEGSLRVVGDPTRVRQILRNLLTNADRYGGPDVALTVSREGEAVVVAVSDDGPGLPDEEWERIFEPYRRAHAAAGQPGSVGIGLSISRELAELMGGSLGYRHEGGRSVFRLSLRPAP
jgi:signal transduction histidine kinase